MSVKRKYGFRTKSSIRVKRRRIRGSKFRKTSRRFRQMGSWAPFGKKKTTKHRYCESISINPAMGVASDAVLSANGMYDPETAFGGHQPYGFDTMTTMYNKYTVIGAKLTLTVASNNNIPFYIGVALRDSAVSLSGTALNVLREQPGIAMTLLQNNSAGGSLKTISKTFSAKKFFGRGRGLLNDAAMQGSDAGNPIEQAFFHVLLVPQAGGDDPITNIVHVKVDYIAVWHEPKILAQS